MSLLFHIVHTPFHYYGPTHTSCLSLYVIPWHPAPFDRTRLSAAR